MKLDLGNNQDLYQVVLSIWIVLASVSILLIDPLTYILAIALLIVIITMTCLRVFPYSSFISMAICACIYALVFYSIYPFTLQGMINPIAIILIFAATAGLGTLILRKLSQNYSKIRNDMQLLSDLIQYDTATGLLLWRHASQKLEEELARCRRYQKSFGLVIFESVNSDLDHLGVNERRELNQSVAKVLLQTCRSDVDIAFTGHHFGVILPETDHSGALAFARRLQANAAKNALLELRVATTSFPTDGVTSEILLAGCDAALKSAIENDIPILTVSSLHDQEKIAATNAGNVDKITSPVQKRQIDNYEQINLGKDEYLLSFNDFYDMADLSLIQETLTNYEGIQEVHMQDYTDGKLIFKVKSKNDLTTTDSFNKIKQELRKNWIKKNRREV
jgi:diguanylate cyclase (GGDEF)-like protein